MFLSLYSSPARPGWPFEPFLQGQVSWSFLPFGFPLFLSVSAFPCRQVQFRVPLPLQVNVLLKTCLRFLFGLPVLDPCGVLGTLAWPGAWPSCPHLYNELGMGRGFGGLGRGRSSGQPPQGSATSTEKGSDLPPDTLLPLWHPGTAF